MQNSSTGQSLELSHSSVAGQSSVAAFTHLLPPSMVLAHLQSGLPLQTSGTGPDSQIAVLPLQGFLRRLLLASAGDHENKERFAVPKSAPTVSLMALSREMVSEASPG